MRALAERAFRWSALTTIGRFGVQLVVQVLLARLLGPENFGVYGIAMVLLTFATFLCGNSFSYSLLLKDQVSDEDVRFAFTWQMIAGVAGAVAMFASAPLVASFFADDRLVPMVRWMSLACILLAAAGPATSLLQRELDFRALGLIQLGSYCVGYLGVGLSLAMQGHGALALAAACLAQSAASLVGSYVALRHPVRPLLRHPGMAATLVTGRTVFLTNAVNWLLNNLDRVVIGRMLGPQPVGLYNVAYNLSSIPNTLLINAVQPTFMAAGARVAQEPHKLARAWLSLLSCALVLLTPAAAVLAVIADDLVRLLYGPEWQQAGWVLALMFACMPAWVCCGFSTPVLWNTGGKHLEYRLQLPLLLLAVPAWALGARYGIQGVAVVTAALVLARTVLIMQAGLRRLSLSWGTLVPALLRGVSLGVAGGAAALAGQLAVRPTVHPVVSIAAASSAALVMLGIIVLLRPRAVVGAEVHEALLRFLPMRARPAPDFP